MLVILETQSDTYVLLEGEDNYVINKQTHVNIELIHECDFDMHIHWYKLQLLVFDTSIYTLEKKLVNVALIVY